MSKSGDLKGLGGCDVLGTSSYSLRDIMVTKPKDFEVTPDCSAMLNEDSKSFKKGDVIHVNATFTWKPGKEGVTKIAVSSWIRFTMANGEYVDGPKIQIRRDDHQEFSPVHVSAIYELYVNEFIKVGLHFRFNKEHWKGTKGTAAGLWMNAFCYRTG